jgi:hypothetical protein
MGANAVTTVPVYTAGEVLTAADLNITNSGIPVFADSTARDAAFGGTGEKTLAEGQFACNAMGASITGVVVAGCFSVLVALIHTMRKENRKDHGEVQRSLGRIEQKIDGHTENHK